MNLSVGIVGLPNVGKSTLFNALLKKQQALAANYPFATIEPNVGVVAVPDSRLQTLAEITALELAGSAGKPHPNPLLKGEGMNTEGLKLPPIKPATVEFVDIAGLVKGASEGAGLGNKFLSHIREVKVICHVVRAFEDPNVLKYEEARPLTPERSDGQRGSIDPKSDYETIETELALADLQSLEKQRESKAVKTNPHKLSTINKLIEGLNAGKMARDIQMTDEERVESADFFLISRKPEIIVLNVSEEQYTTEGIQAAVEKYESDVMSQTSPQPSPNRRGSGGVVVISAKVEAELAALSEEERKEYLAGLGLKMSGLERLIRKAYETLGLQSFLTAGEKEVRAWTIKKGINAQNAAGEIHTDFIRKFIKAEVVSFDDFVAYNGWKGSREAGKARLEGKEYIVQDGVVIEFRIGV